MKYLLPLLTVAHLGSCSGGEIPPIQIGGNGARLMTGTARDAADAYDMAYANLSPQHLAVRRNLEPRGQNLYGARAAMERILYCLETMRSLVTPAYQARFDPYLEQYREWQKDISRNIWGGSFLQQFERSEQEIKSSLHPKNVEIARAAPETDPALPSSASDPRVEAPQKPAPVQDGPVPSRPVERSTTAARLSTRLAYKAWDKAHDDLVEAVKQKKDARAAYEDVLEALAILKAHLPHPRAGTLQIYMTYYSDIHEKTGGFKTLPEKTHEQDIVNELNVAARFIRREFNPDK